MNRKLFAALLAAASCAAPAAARQLSADEALARVSGADAGPHRVAATVKPRLIATGTHAGLNTYYAFALPGKTLFLSADDAAVPVLGYTDAEVTDLANIPPQMKWWLGEYGRQIEWAAKHPRQKVGKFSLCRRAPARAPRTDIAPMLRTTWDQGAPYNDECPIFSGNPTYTGCVATAMAQVMYYHRYPAAGKGSVSYTWENDESTLSTSLAVTLDWDNMLLTYPEATSGTAAQRKAISSLMKAVGYSVKMEYGDESLGGSGAATIETATALVNNFSYDKGIQYYYRDHHFTDDWTQRIWDGLQDGPVIYAGEGEAGGHCFVFDGYRAADGFFHVNWGWSGESDGYFAIDALNPESLGAGGGEGGFNYGQEMVVGIRKPVSGSTKQTAAMGIEGYLFGSASGSTVTLIAGDSMMHGFANITPWSANFDIAVALTNNATGTTSYVTCATKHKLGAMEAIGEISFSAASLADGSYTLTPVYRINGSGSAWTEMAYWIETAGYHSLALTKNGSSVTVTGGIDVRPPEQTYISISAPYPNFETGKNYSVPATVVCEEGHDVNCNIITCLAIDDPENPGFLAVVDGTEGPSTPLSIRDGETKTVNFPVTIPASLEPGTYYLLFTLDSAIAFGMLNDDNYEVTVTKGSDVPAQGDPANVQVSYNADSESLIIGQTNNIAATVLNADLNPVTMSVYAALCTEDETSLTILGQASSPKVEFTVPGSGTLDVTFPVAIDASVEEGDYYLAFVYEPDGEGPQLLNSDDFYVTAEKGTGTDPLPSAGYDIAAEHVETVWTSSANTSLQSWHAIAGTPSRAIAYKDGNLYVLHSASGAGVIPTIQIVDAFAGTAKGTVPTDGVLTTLFKLSDLIAFDGKLVASGISGVSQDIHVYAWESDTSAPRLILTAPAGSLGGECGGAISASGTWDNGRIWLSPAGSATVYYFEIANGLVSDTPHEIVLTDKNGKALASAGSDGRGTARVHVNADGSFWHTRMGSAPVRYHADGTFAEAIADDVIGNKNYGTAFVPFVFGNRNYAVATAYNGAANVGQGGQMALVDLRDGVAAASAICHLPQQGFGNATNAQRITGACVALTDNNTTVNIWAHSALQGLGYFRYKGSEHTAVSDIAVDNDTADSAEPEYYTLQGVRVAADRLTPGFYIRRAGTRATKVLIR